MSGEKTKQTGMKVGKRTSSKPPADYLAKIALDLFAERHYASVTIKNIGRAAHANSAMIYYYYRDKQDLFRAALDFAVDEAFQLFSDHCNSDKHDNPADAISAWFDVHVALYKQLRAVLKISVDCKGLVGNVPKADEPIQRFYRHENEILRDLVSEGIDEGMFEDVDPAVVATMISTMLDGVLARSIYLEDFDIHKTVQGFKVAILQYLGYRMAPPKAVRSAKKVGNGRKTIDATRREGRTRRKIAAKFSSISGH